MAADEAMEIEETPSTSGEKSSKNGKIDKKSNLPWYVNKNKLQKYL